MRKLINTADAQRTYGMIKDRTTWRTKHTVEGETGKSLDLEDFQNTEQVHV